ncbi:MAG: hypothetical protein OJF50_000958 [Nitrospira sp.]|nr:hypothetical protein [Nitrospira sp.]
MPYNYSLRCQPLVLSMVIGGFICVSGCGVSSKSVYPGTGTTFNLTEPGVQVLGKVTSCQGGYCRNDETGKMEWPISLQAPPPAATYQAAIRRKAARLYNVPESQIVIGEIDVSYTSEIVGTIRGWSATAMVGKRTEGK